MALIGIPTATPVTTYSEKHVETTVLASAAASIAFSTGLTTYKFFRLTCYIAKDGTGAVLRMLINGDTGANYARQRIGATSTTVVGQRVTGQAYIDLTTINVITANNEASASILVAKPAAGVKAQVVAQVGLNATTELDLIGAEWNNTADAISSLTLLPESGNFAAGTSISLFGVAT